MAEQRWRAAEILRLGIGEGQQLVYARATRTARVLPRPQAALLASCQTFRTIATPGSPRIVIAKR